MSRAASPTSCARPRRTACCSPTSGTTSTTARRTISRPARKSGRRPQGKVDGFICSVGTGGTLAGTSIFLREKKKDIVIGVADPRGAAMYNLFTTGEAKSHRRRLDHRRHRARPRHADHRRHQGRQGLSHPRRGGGADHLRPARARRPLPRRLVRHQRRRRDPPRQGAGAGQHHRHGARRLRHALPVQAVQSGIPALEEAAGAGLAGAASRTSKSRSRRSELSRRCPPTACSARIPICKDCERHRRRHRAGRRHRARPHGVLRGLRRPAGRPRHARPRNRATRSRSPTWSSPIPARPTIAHVPAPGAPAGRGRRHGQGRDRLAHRATPACACTRRCICSPRCCPIRSPAARSARPKAGSTSTFPTPASTRTPSPQSSPR